MRARPLVFFCCALAIGISALAETSTSQPMYAISGTVVDASTEAPLSRVHLVLFSNALHTQAAEFITNTDGHFQFNALEGMYNLSAEGDGIPRQMLGQQNEGPGSSIVVGRDKDTVALKFRLRIPGAITGVVSDEAGEPVEGALVQLVRRDLAGGHERLVPVKQTYTDDLGHYRFSGLLFKECYIGVTGAPWYSQILTSPNDPEASSAIDTRAFTPTYNSQPHQPSGIMPIQVKSGGEVQASFTLLPTPGSRVVVKLVEDSESTMDQGDIVMRTVGANTTVWTQHIAQDAGFGYTTQVVPSGRYTVDYQGVRKGVPVYASQAVEVGTVPVEVSISPTPLSKISGVFRSQNGMPLSGVQGVVGLFDLENQRSVPALASGPGSFEFMPAWPGTYQVALVGNVELYIKQVLVDGQVQSNRSISVSPTYAPRLTLVLSDDGGCVKGVVRREGRNQSELLVLLAPKLTRGDRVASLSFETDSDGSFTFSNVPPGEYRLFATSKIDLRYASDDAVLPYLASATNVIVKSKETSNEVLTPVIPSPADPLQK